MEQSRGTCNKIDGCQWQSGECKPTGSIDTYCAASFDALAENREAGGVYSFSGYANWAHEYWWDQANLPPGEGVNALLGGRLRIDQRLGHDKQPSAPNQRSLHP